MENPTCQTYLADPDVRTQIDRGARRARAAAGYRYLVLPVVQFCGRLLAVRGVRLHLDPRATAVLLIVALQVFAESVPIETDLDGNASALIAA